MPGVCFSFLHAHWPQHSNRKPTHQSWTFRCCAGHCSGRPARADWQALVRPALLLMSLHKQLLQGVDLQHTEADALKPLDWPLAMEGLVALQQKLTE